MIAAILGLSLMWMGGPAAAQESGHQWRDVDTNVTYNTQQQALAATQTRPGGYQWVSALKKREITETAVTLTYGIPTEASQVNEWTYVTFGLTLKATEEDFTAALKGLYDQKSIDAGCSPNTTASRYTDWATLNQWPDNTASRQMSDFKIKWNRKSSGTCALYDDNEYIIRSRDRCSNEYLTYDPNNNTCSDDFYVARLSAPPLYCDSCTLVGDPVDFSTGDQYETETDVDLGWISFVRSYHSVSSSAAAGFGYGWTHSHDIRLAIQGITDPILGLIQANGSHLPFRQFTGYYEAVDGSGDRITASGTNWVLQRSGDSLTFNAAGQLLEQRGDNGEGLTYAYDAVGRLVTITHSTGRSLVIAYSGAAANASIASVSSSGLALATYTYTPRGQVATVTYPGGIATRTYHYEDANFPQNLTGISVEGGVRYSTFAYDAKGRSISAQLAGGVDGVTVAYSAQGGAVVTDALGDATSYGLTTAGDAAKPRKAGDLTDSKGTVGRTYYDDASDFRRRIDTVTDRKGTQTKHTYTEANDPVTGQPAWTHSTTEAVGLPQQRIGEERRDSASNRVILTRIGNRETRIVRNARLKPASVTVRDTISNEVRTVTYAYCEATDVAAVNSACPTLGLLKSVDGPRTDVNDVTMFQYYGSDDSTCATQPALCTYRKGDLRKTIDALGRATEVLGYDPQGRPLSVLDPNGVVTDYEYHSRGWLTATKVRGANNAVETDDRITRIEHEPTGLVKQVTLPSGVYTRYTYDAAQRLSDVIDSVGNKIHYTVDLAGNIKQEDTRTAGGTLKQTLSRVFNVLGQLDALKDASGNATTFGYDNNGNPDRIKDALGRETLRTLDPLNRLSQTLQHDGATAVDTRLQYNALDQITKVTDPKGLDTLYAYNGFGDQIRLTSPDTGVADYTYNAAGLLATKKDANDTTAHRYAYDALNRPTAIFYTALNVADVEYVYDTVNAQCAAGETFALGRVTAMRTDGMELKYCYDRFGQIVRKVQSDLSQSQAEPNPGGPGCGGPIDSRSASAGCVDPVPQPVDPVASNGLTLRYAYAIDGQLQSVTYPDGTVVDYVRNALGRVQEIGVRPSGGTRQVLLTNASYEPFGPVSGWSYGNGRGLARSYDLDYRPKSILDNASGGLSLGYGYNTVGELTDLKDGLQSTLQAKYDYDALGRLKVTRDGPTGTALETYGYDATGNRTSLLRSGITDTYTYPGNSHHLSSIGATTRSYDAVGNTIAIGGTAKEYVYDANDRMKQVKQGGAVTMGYRYNAKGERVVASAGDSGVVTAYTLYDEAGHWIGDYDNAGAPIQQAIWMGDAPVGLLAGAGIAQSLKYVQPDHLGTPRAVIDPARNVAIWTWDAKSEAFGNSPPNQDPDLDGTAFVFDMRFPGQRYDAASGLVYNYFRDFDPGAGRYLQSDPIGLRGGINNYAYVGNSPLHSIDPLGLLGGDSWRQIGSSYSNTPGQYHSNPLMQIKYKSGDSTIIRAPDLHRYIICLQNCVQLPLIITGAHEGAPYHRGRNHPAGLACDFGCRSNPLLCGKPNEDVKQCASDCGFTNGMRHAPDHWHLSIAPGDGVPALPPSNISQPTVPNVEPHPAAMQLSPTIW